MMKRPLAGGPETVRGVVAKMVVVSHNLDMFLDDLFENHDGTFFSNAYYFTFCVST